MAESKNNQSVSEEALHYNTLLSAFKWLVTAITILTIAAVWFIGNNLTDIRRDLSDELLRLKSDIAALRVESDRLVAGTKVDAEKQIDLLRKNTETYLNLTKDLTGLQISAIREDAKNLALSTARQRIEEAFKARDIQLLVETAAKEEIGDRLDQIVQAEIQKTTEVFDAYPNLTTMYDRIRSGDRTALDVLDSVAAYSDNPAVKRAATSLLVQKGKDYEESLPHLFDIDTTLFNPLAHLNIETPSPFTHDDSLRVRSALRAIILKDTDLYRVTLAFIGFRNLTGIKVKTFDISFIKQINE